MSALIETLLPVASLIAAPHAAHEAPAATSGSELGAGIRLEAGGAPIDVTVGHAAPYVMDVDGDGVRDLLVGEFGTGSFDGARMPESTRRKWSGGKGFANGKLRVYRNVGTDDDPLFADYAYLEAKEQHASIPTT